MYLETDQTYAYRSFNDIGKTVFLENQLSELRDYLNKLLEEGNEVEIDD